VNELLKNDKAKQDKLKKIIKKLHRGANIKEVKKEFSNLIKNVSPEEISNMENALIHEGLPPEEIQSLCDVHVEVFKDTLSKQKKEKKSAEFWITINERFIHIRYFPLYVIAQYHGAFAPPPPPPPQGGGGVFYFFIYLYTLPRGWGRG